MILPSKELLSEVLAPEFCIEVDLFRENELKIWLLQHGDATKTYINIYELVHLLKEWAYDKNIKISTTRLNDKRYMASIYGVGHFDADTYPECLFIACEWILNTKGSK